MWNRLKRLFRSIFGGIIDSAEDPELILQQLIRDMRDKMLERSMTQLQVRVTELDNKVKAAIKTGRDDIATAYIGELQSNQKNLETTRMQLESARTASEKARKFRENYMLQMKKKQDEAMQ